MYCMHFRGGMETGSVAEVVGDVLTKACDRLGFICGVVTGFFSTSSCGLYV